MKPYQDKDTCYHDKIVTNGEPSSNNPMIYTAYSKYLATDTIDRQKIIARFLKCTKSLYPLKINRHPGVEKPLYSKDEVVGAVSLGLISDSELSKSHYNFCNTDDEFERKLSLKSIFVAMKALFKIRKEHRNYVWENRIVEAYPLAFRLPPEDIYYVQKYSGISPNILNTAIFYANMAIVWTKGDKSSRMMLFLKLNDLGHPFRKLIPYKKWVRDYFPADHPFSRFLK